jgi:hypothetical protein
MVETRSMIQRRKILKSIEKIEREYDMWIYSLLFYWAIHTGIGTYILNSGHNYIAAGWFLAGGIFITAMA